MRRLERRLTASLEWLNNNIDCFSPRQAGELSEAGVKALSELAIAYAWLEDCCTRSSPLANFSPLQQSFELWRAFIIRQCEEMSHAQSALPTCKYRLTRITTQPPRATSTDTSARRM